MAEELIRSRASACRESALWFGCRDRCGDAKLLRAQERRQTKEIRQMEIKREDGRDSTRLPHEEAQMRSDTCLRESNLAWSHLATLETTPASSTPAWFSSFAPLLLSRTHHIHHSDTHTPP